MRILKTIFASAVMATCGLTAFAQNPVADEEAQSLGYKPQPYGFVQVQGGVNKVFSPGSKFNPTFSVGVGGMFTPIVGARLHVNGLETKNGFGSIDDTYKFKYITSDLDLMLNIVNIFSKKNLHPVDVYLIEYILYEGMRVTVVDQGYFIAGNDNPFFLLVDPGLSRSRIVAERCAHVRLGG